MIKFWFISFFVLWSASCAIAKTLLIEGQTFDIAEPDLLRVIQERLLEMDRQGEIEAFKKEQEDKTRAYVARPTPLDLTTTSIPSSFVVDLSITVQEDITDHRGNVIAAKGDKVDPLDHMVRVPTMWFIDGDDPEQVALALQTGTELDTYLILTKGNPIELSGAYGRRFWFDQQAQLTNRLKISSVPAKAYKTDAGMTVQLFSISEFSTRK